jgi:Flp pilus assembly pilin Flp
MKRFVREDAGLEMAEWAIVGVLITLAAAATIGNLQLFVNLRLAQVAAIFAFF